MAQKHDSKSDPARTIALLWRSRLKDEAQRRHGPKPSLSIDQLVNTAIAIADVEGIGAVTVRRVAREMGVAAMSLYTYVANKGELVELMVDAVYLEMHHQGLVDKDWRLRIETIARDNFVLYRRHPWMVDVYPERPPLGPGVITKYERELRALEGLGLSDVEMDSALTFVLNFVRAAAGDEIQSKRLLAATAMTTGEWWAAYAQALALLVSPEEFPTAVRVGAAAGAINEGAYNAAPAFEFGLQRVLDGLGQLVATEGQMPLSFSDFGA